MKSFLNKYASQVKEVLSGFDRLRFSGNILILAKTRGLGKSLSYQRVLLKNFKHWAKGLTDMIVQSAEELAATEKRPLMYLPSSRDRKEDIAQDIAEQDNIQEGLVCVLRLLI